MILVSHIMSLKRGEMLYAKSLDTLAKKDGNQYTILVFSALRVASSLAFYWRYLEKASAALLSLP